MTYTEIDITDLDKQSDTELINAWHNTNAWMLKAKGKKQHEQE